MSCTVTTRELDNISIVELSGKFTMTDASGVIRGAISNVLNAGHKRILLDLANVTYLDSAAGIGELVSGYTTAFRHGAQLKLLNANRNVDRVLRIVGLHQVFDMYDDEAAAIRSFEQHSQAGATNS